MINIIYKTKIWNKNNIILLYAVEKTPELKKTNLKHEDRFLQKITASGKSCSGKVKGFAQIAVPGSYNQDGTKKN